jgi:hypothetical protein
MCVLSAVRKVIYSEQYGAAIKSTALPCFICAQGLAHFPVKSVP